MIVRTDTGYPNTYAGMGSYALSRRAFGLGEIDEETGLSPDGGLPSGVFTDITNDPISGWSAGASAGSMMPPGAGVGMDANGNWVDATGKLTSFNTSGGSGAPGSTNYNPGVFSNLLNTLAITTPAVVAAVNGTAISTAAQCAAAGGQWTGANCVKQTTNSSMLLMYAVGAGVLLLILSKRGR